MKGKKPTMTLEQRRAKECTPKKKMTVAEAQRVIKQVWFEEKTKLFFYECDFCGGVHLTRG